MATAQYLTPRSRAGKKVTRAELVIYLYFSTFTTEPWESHELSYECSSVNSEELG